MSTHGAGDGTIAISKPALVLLCYKIMPLYGLQPEMR